MKIFAEEYTARMLIRRVVFISIPGYNREEAGDNIEVDFLR